MSGQAAALLRRHPRLSHGQALPADVAAQVEGAPFGRGLFLDPTLSGRPLSEELGNALKVKIILLAHF
jgi:hypothetical protein